MGLTLKDYRNRNLSQLRIELNKEKENRLFWIRSFNNYTDSYNRNRSYNHVKRSETLIKRMQRVIREKS